MLHLVVAAAFENIGETDDIALDVSVRILQGIANAGLGGQVDDLVELLVGKQLVHAGTVGHVELDEAEAGQRSQALQTALLERDFVVIVQIVEADDLVAAGQEAQ